MKDVTKTSRDVELALCVQETQASFVWAEGLRNEAGWTALSPVWKILHWLMSIPTSSNILMYGTVHRKHDDNSVAG